MNLLKMLIFWVKFIFCNVFFSFRKIPTPLIFDRFDIVSPCFSSHWQTLPNLKKFIIFKKSEILF
jgi:hypothetical protein